MGFVGTAWVNCVVGGVSKMWSGVLLQLPYCFE